jgi:hypothetical protein
MDPVGLNFPVLGSNNSAEESWSPFGATPPAMRTRPSERRVAVCRERATVIGPVGVNREETVAEADGAGV